jgi:hypothetical protein
MDYIYIFYKMKYRKGIKKEYVFLIIVLLLGLILASFIKPFMEGFKVKCTPPKCPSGWTPQCSGPVKSCSNRPKGCKTGYAYNEQNKNCVSMTNPSSTMYPFCANDNGVEISTDYKKSPDSNERCYYNP